MVVWCIEIRLNPTILASEYRNHAAFHVTYTIRGGDHIAKSYSPHFTNDTTTWDGVTLAIFHVAQFYYHKTVPT